MPSLVLFTDSTGHHLRAFEDAAQQLDVRLVYAVDGVEVFDEAWHDRAIAVRSHDVEQSVRTVVELVQHERPVGVLALSDQTAVLAAHIAAALDLPFHSPLGAEVAASTLMTRGRLLAHDLPCPWFASFPSNVPLHDLAARVRFPCIVKPARRTTRCTSIRVDSPDALVQALARLRTVLEADALRMESHAAHSDILIEGYVPGLEYALEAVMEQGAMRVLAIFAKLDGVDSDSPERTTYVTPPSVPAATEQAMATTVARAALGMGLHHGPLHAECRINASGVFVIKLAARPIGHPCTRALRFGRIASLDDNGLAQSRLLTLEELLVRHALGESLAGYGREASASAVMTFRMPNGASAEHLATAAAEARAVAGVDEIGFAAAAHEPFIIARAPLPEQALRAVRAAHDRSRIALASR